MDEYNVRLTDEQVELLAHLRREFGISEEEQTVWLVEPGKPAVKVK